MKKSLRNERSTTALACVIMLCFVIMGAVAAYGLLGQDTHTTFAHVSDNL